MTIFEFISYKAYFQQKLLGFPNQGYGQRKKLAHYLGVSTTFVSQVFQGNKYLNLEQGCLVCEYLGLNELETEYFLKLVLIERAGSGKLKNQLNKEATKIRDQARRVASRLGVHRVLDDVDKAIFYSDWSMSAVRLLIGIDGYSSIEEVSNYLGLPRKTVSQEISFLVRVGLLVREGGTLKMGSSRTHLEQDSPFINSHHTNWRVKALDKLKDENPDKLHYSAPMTLGKKEAEKVRNVLLKSIESIGKLVDPSPNEELMCLNVDWFRIGSSSTAPKA